MKTKVLIIGLLCAVFCSCKELPEDEKKLKDQFESYLKLAETSEQKKYIEQQYEQALIELKEARAEKERKSKIFYSEKNDITSELFEFCNELWVDENYNPAKYKVKEKQFKDKSIAINGPISYIISEDERNYFAMYYQKEKIELNWLNSKSRGIVFLFNFNNPEEIMNLKKGQKVSVEAVYSHSHKSSDFDDDTYFFNFYNPTIKENHGD